MDRRLEAIAGAPALYAESSENAAFQTPIPAFTGRTMYLAYRVTAAPAAYVNVALLRPSPSGAEDSGTLAIQTTAAGSTNLRVVTRHVGPGTSTSTIPAIPNALTIGGHIVFAQELDGQAGVLGGNEAGYVSSIVTVDPAQGSSAAMSRAVVPDFLTRYALVVFPAVHDVATRTNIMGWLAQRYGIPL